MRISVAGQINDLADKLDTWESAANRSGSYTGEGNDKKAEDKLAQATKDASKITTEVLHGIMSQVIKDRLFNHPIMSAAGPGSGCKPMAIEEEK